MTLATPTYKGASSADAIGLSVERAAKALRAQQSDDGHWRVRARSRCDHSRRICAAPAFSAERRAITASSAKIAAYLRRIQADHGGWPLVHGGAFDISASVKAYFALKMIGDDPRSAAYAAGARGDPRPRRRRRKPTYSPAACSRFSASCRGGRCR